ncbi:MAG: ABC transporter permease [Pseudomonadota bacterium]
MQTRSEPLPSPFRVHLRVVGAMLRREMSTKYGATSGGYFWAVAEPAGMIGIMSLAFAAIGRQPDLGQSYIVFFATGFLAFNFYRFTAQELFRAIRANRALLKYPNVTIYDALVARATLQTLTNVMVTIVILGTAILWSGQRVQLDFAQIFPALAAATLLAFGMGTLNATLFPLFPVYERLFNIVNRPLFIISGVLYIPEMLPATLQELQSWNPLAHVISAFRAGVYPSYSPVQDDLLYVSSCGLAALLAGLLLLRRNADRLLDR